MNENDPNVRLVEGLLHHLGELKDQFVFVGGCATGLLITDRARPPVRTTTDIDLVTKVVTRSDYYILAEKLRNLGFTEDMKSEVICRWRIEEYEIDVMPDDEEILGFTNRWYRKAIETATQCILPSGATISLISPPLFLATKLEAFHDRGNDDYGVSHDMEDIITIVDGRPEIVEEIASIDGDVREYLRDEFDSLLAELEFTNTIHWHLSGDAFNQDRVTIIIERLRNIAEL